MTKGIYTSILRVNVFTLIAGCISILNIVLQIVTLEEKYPKIVAARLKRKLQNRKNKQKEALEKLVNEY